MGEANHLVDDAVAVLEVGVGPKETKRAGLGARGTDSTAGRRFGTARWRVWGVLTQGPSGGCVGCGGPARGRDYAPSVTDGKRPKNQ
jgi:hypothetical protein